VNDTANPSSRQELQTSGKPPSLWRNRDYLLLWSGQVVSSTGSQFSELAFPLLILFLTGSAVQAGIAGALGVLPYLVFSLPAGALVDRWDRKRVMIICDSGRAVVLASIPLALLLGHLTIAQLYVTSMAEGTLFVFFNLAQVSCLPRVVSKEQLPAATAQNITTFSLASLIGSPLAGALYALGKLFPFLVDAVSYILSAITLSLMHVQFQEERSNQKQQSVWRNIAEGLVWLWRHPLIRYMAILTGGLNLITAGRVLIIIVLAQRLHASAFVIGLIFTLAGVGSICGAILAPIVQKRLRFGTVIIGFCWIITVSYPLYALAPSVLLLGLNAAFLSLVFPSYDVVQFSYRSMLIPDALQGRVNSVFRLLAYGGQPLGLTLAGILIESLGVVVTVFILATGFLALALLTTLNPQVRRAGPARAH
jgi:predicted MFS family arabinose efflux permease